MPRFARLQPSPTLLSLPLQPSARPPCGRGCSKSLCGGKLLQSGRGAIPPSADGCRWAKSIPCKENPLQRASLAKSISCKEHPLQRASLAKSIPCKEHPLQRASLAKSIFCLERRKTQQHPTPFCPSLLPGLNEEGCLHPAGLSAC